MLKSQVPLAERTVVTLTVVGDVVSGVIREIAGNDISTTVCGVELVDSSIRAMVNQKLMTQLSK